MAGVAIADAGLLVQPERITRLAGDTRADEVVTFATVDLQAKTARQFDADLTVKADGNRHVRSSHSVRRGHPADAQAFSSSKRQRVERLIRTGRGISPRASQVRHVRTDFPHNGAASLASTRIVSM